MVTPNPWSRFRAWLSRIIYPDYYKLYLVVSEERDNLFAAVERLQREIENMEQVIHKE